ncbi:MAG: hypothetical protein MUF04_08040 [Akkermansiaceae bacterium]|jgi:plasmid stability protein|nr:hypothetical protein [Akkermansiaceae bacterium]
MKNITLKIDDETYRKARVRAAREGSSVSAVVRGFLAGFAEDGDAGAHTRHVAALKKLYAKADARATPGKRPVPPLTRDEIYAERLR